MSPSTPAATWFAAVRRQFLEQCRLQLTMIERTREHLIAAGLATTKELEQHLADIDAGRLDLAAFPVVSAWGRKAR